MPLPLSSSLSNLLYLSVRGSHWRVSPTDHIRALKMIPHRDTDSTRNCSSEQLISAGHFSAGPGECIVRNGAARNNMSKKIKEPRLDRNPSIHAGPPGIRNVVLLGIVRRSLKSGKAREVQTFTGEKTRCGSVKIAIANNRSIAKRETKAEQR